MRGRGEEEERYRWVGESYGKGKRRDVSDGGGENNGCGWSVGWGKVWVSDMWVRQTDAVAWRVE